MKAAVTAASGQLGAATAKECVATLGAHNVVGLARTPAKAAGLGIEVRPGDYNEPAQLEESLAGVDAVLLVSGMDAPDQRIIQHRNVIDAAVAAGVGKIVYTSVQGDEQGTDFSPIISSNRQTEADIRASGLDWVIGRNGIYIEPDVDYLDTYVAEGGLRNCAGDGRCGYTTRSELAYAYARMLTEDQHRGQTYNLHGEAITQTELATYLSGLAATELRYVPMSIEEYRIDRISELGNFLGTVISGIYAGIHEGASDNPSHYAAAAGRDHVGWPEYFAALAAERNK